MYTSSLSSAKCWEQAYFSWVRLSCKNIIILIFQDMNVWEFKNEWEADIYIYEHGPYRPHNHRWIQLTSEFKYFLFFFPS